MDPMGTIFFRCQLSFNSPSCPKVPASAEFAWRANDKAGNGSYRHKKGNIQRSPVELGSLSHDLQGFIHLRWVVLARFLRTINGPPRW